MKAILKSMFAVIAGAVLLAACDVGSASAADMNLVKSTGGTAAYGLAKAVVVDQDTGAGHNRVYLKFIGGNEQLVDDDGSWSKYNAAKTALTARGAMRVGTSNRYVVVQDSIFTDCYQNQSRTWFPSTNNAEAYSDGCAFFDAVKANAF